MNILFGILAALGTAACVRTYLRCDRLSDSPMKLFMVVWSSVSAVVFTALSGCFLFIDCDWSLKDYAVPVLCFLASLTAMLSTESMIADEATSTNENT